jgi:hypothetical protein
MSNMTCAEQSPVPLSVRTVADLADMTDNEIERLASSAS